MPTSPPAAAAAADLKEVRPYGEAAAGATASASASASSEATATGEQMMQQELLGQLQEQLHTFWTQHAEEFVSAWKSLQPAQRSAFLRACQGGQDLPVNAGDTTDASGRFIGVSAALLPELCLASLSEGDGNALIALFQRRHIGAIDRKWEIEVIGPLIDNSRIARVYEDGTLADAQTGAVLKRDPNMNPSRESSEKINELKKEGVLLDANLHHFLLQRHLIIMQQLLAFAEKFMAGVSKSAAGSGSGTDSGGGSGSTVAAS
jgi:hypothetical protein